MINTNRVALAAAFIVLALIASMMKVGPIKTLFLVIPCGIFWVVVVVVVIVLIQFAINEWRRDG